MRIDYFPETHTLYIAFNAETGMDTLELAPDVMADLGKVGQLIGIEIEHASSLVDLTKLEVSTFPVDISKSTVAG